MENSGGMNKNILNGEITILRQEALGLACGVVNGEDFPSTFTSTAINGIQKVHETIGLQIVCILGVRKERLGGAITQRGTSLGGVVNRIMTRSGRSHSKANGTSGCSERSCSADGHEELKSLNKRRLHDRWTSRVKFTSGTRFIVGSKMPHSVTFNVVGVSTDNNKDSTTSVVVRQTIVVYRIGNHLDNYLG